MSTISAGTTVGTALVNTGDTTGNLVIKTGANATTALTISGTDQSITVAGGLNLGTPIPATSGGTGLSSVGTAGNVLTSNGTTWVSAAAAAFDSGTLMLFQQTSAPTGWTKQTTHNDKALRVVSGSASSGGTTAFTTVFTNQTPTINTSGLSAGATTLSTSQIPAHTHFSGIQISQGCTGSGIAANQVSTSAGSNVNTGSTGGGGSHTHTVSGSATSSAITLNVAYVDLIIASKN